MCIKEEGKSIPPVPMSKEEFVSYIDFIREKEEQETVFSDTLSKLGGGDGYAYLYSEYKWKLIKLLDDVWLDPKPEYRDVDYFCCEQEYGAKADEYGIYVTEEDGTETVIVNHNAEELYDYLCKEWPERWREKYGDK